MHSRKWASLIIAAGILGGLSLGSPVSLAQNKEKTIKPETITCEEFLAMDKDVQPLVVYWIDGYENAGDAKAEGVVIHIFERPISTVVSECRKAPKDALAQKIKKNL
jgi:acid stress chaperone HdeA